MSLQKEVIEVVDNTAQWQKPKEGYFANAYKMAALRGEPLKDHSISMFADAKWNYENNNAKYPIKPGISSANPTYVNVGQNSYARAEGITEEDNIVVGSDGRCFKNGKEIAGNKGILEFSKEVIDSRGNRINKPIRISKSLLVATTFREVPEGLNFDIAIKSKGEAYHIDHKNSDHDDNRIENLIICSPTENHNNIFSLLRNSYSNIGYVLGTIHDVVTGNPIAYNGYSLKEQQLMGTVPYNIEMSSLGSVRSTRGITRFPGYIKYDEAPMAVVYNGVLLCCWADKEGVAGILKARTGCSLITDDNSLRRLCKDNVVSDNLEFTFITPVEYYNFCRYSPDLVLDKVVPAFYKKNDDLLDFYKNGPRWIIEYDAIFSKKLGIDTKSGVDADEIIRTTDTVSGKYANSLLKEFKKASNESIRSFPISSPNVITSIDTSTSYDTLSIGEVTPITLIVNNACTITLNGVYNGNHTFTLCKEQDTATIPQSIACCVQEVLQ